MLGCHHARSISARWEAESLVAAWRRSRSLCGEAAGAGTAGGTLLNTGSAGVMERAAGHKSGITFGADQNQKPPSP